MKIEIQIHEKALEISGRFKRVESDLIDILQKVDEHRVYQRFECRTLFEYTMKILKLSESVAFNFIAVARKAQEVPELKKVIASGALSVSKARKITPVLNKENHEEWLKMAVELPQRKLEEQVAIACPKEAAPEKLKFINADRLALQMSISKSLNEKLKRAQDIECQKRQKAVGLEETLESLLEAYLEKYDPVKKAEKLQGRKNLAVARQVTLRDQGQCTYLDRSGQRCDERRWLDVHHIRPRSQGGDNSVENLTSLCSGHHRLTHCH